MRSIMICTLHQILLRVIKSRRLRWAGHVACRERMRDAYRVLLGKPEGKRLHGRPRPRWEDNIKIDLKEVGWGAWTGLAWLRIWTDVNAIVNHQDP
jgi:hypothetical protein